MAHPTIKKYGAVFREGFVRGIGSAFGATVGFVIVSSALIYGLQFLGGVPFVGQWLATIVTAMIDALQRR